MVACRMSQASMYVAMLLIGWQLRTDDDKGSIDVGQACTWAKMSTVRARDLQHAATAQ